MEQSTGPVIPPMHTAGTDPANVPGLTFPSPAGTAGAGPEEAPESSTAHDTPGGETPPAPNATGPDAAGATETDPAPRATAADDAEEKPEETAGDQAEEGDAPAAGPAFEAADRRASVTVDHTGVRFRLDEEEAQFSWDEVGAVEVDTPRFGRRFHVTVYLSSHRWYEADVDAPDRARLKAWTAELDSVLDAYFGDTEDAEPSDTEPSDTKSSGDAAEAETDAADTTDATDTTKESEGTSKVQEDQGAEEGEPAEPAANADAETEEARPSGS